MPLPSSDPLCKACQVDPDPRGPSACADCRKLKEAKLAFTQATGLPQRIFNAGSFWFDLEQISAMCFDKVGDDDKPYTAIWLRSDTGDAGAFEVSPETGALVVEAWQAYFNFKTYNEVK